MIPYHTSRLGENQLELDLTHLILLSSNDPGFKNKILGMLHEQAKIVTNDLESALSSANRKAIADTAHKFKSSVNIVSQETHNQLKELERDAREGESISQLHVVTRQSISLIKLLASSIEQELAKSS